MDDPNNRRWTVPQIDLGLRVALSKCQNYYQQNGGDRFDEEVIGTTNPATGGLLVAPLVTPAQVLTVKDISVTVGNVVWRVPPKDKIRRGYADLNARTLNVLLVKEYPMPTAAIQPLVGVGPVPANSWADFDSWVCAECAYLIGSKDLEGARLRFLDTLRQQFRDSVNSRQRIPGGYETPRKEWSPMYDWLQWQWKPATNEVFTVRKAW